METKYFYSEAKQEAVCLRHPYHIENIILSTDDPQVIKIAHYNDKFMYTLLQETWDNFECAKTTYDAFKKQVLRALNLEDSSEKQPVISHYN